MDDTHALHTAVAQQAGHRPHGGLVEWHSISVLRFADGVTRATYNHLDMGQRKLIAEALDQPAAAPTGLQWFTQALLCAAEELEGRVEGLRGL